MASSASIRWFADLEERVLVVELAGALRHQPVEGVGAGLHLRRHPREGAGKVAELVGAAPDALKARRLVARVLEGGRGIGDLDHRGGDLPPHVEPANDEGAKDADRVECEEQRLADIDGAVRRGYCDLSPRLDLLHQVVDVAGERRREASRLRDQGFRLLLFLDERAAKLIDAVRPEAEGDEFPGRLRHGPKSARTDHLDCPLEAVGGGLEALHERRDERGVMKVVGVRRAARR